MAGKRFVNTLKTTLLFAVLWVVFLAIGGLLSSSTGEPAWIWIFAAMGLGSTAFTYWNSASFALKQMRAYPVSPQQAPGLYAIVTELSRKMDMPMPSIWVAPSGTPNAFATGRNPKNAAVCCTEGILQILDERQLRGVLAHELMHVQNRDILTASVASAIAGLISSLAQWALLFGGRGRGDRGGNPLAAILMALLAPMAAGMIQMGISRTREYAADADGSALTGDPMALAAALDAITGGVSAQPMAKTPEHDTVSSVMIANPFRGGGVSTLFSTHPPMEKRVARLRQQAQQLGAPLN